LKLLKLEVFGNIIACSFSSPSSSNLQVTLWYTLRIQVQALCVRTIWRQQLDSSPLMVNDSPPHSSLAIIPILAGVNIPYGTCLSSKCWFHYFQWYTYAHVRTYTHTKSTSAPQYLFPK
jgi:hypothetical protein